ncbi:MAG: hypothetical protein IKQ46_13655 [Bacteroidales bacterium]|nr:hypothetical protein [Bacteroidales bacterium]
MRIKKSILLAVIAATLIGCKGKYSNIQVDNEDILGYVNAFTQLDANHKDFLIYIGENSEVDTTQLKDYNDIMHILNLQGFPDIEYFMAVHSKLDPVVKVISQNPDVERYPGIGTADLSFLEEGEKQYRKFLEDSTISQKDKEFYQAQMSQIETTKVDLFDKQEKNRHWVQLVRSESQSKTDVNLDDNSIMQLTILEREISKL